MISTEELNEIVARSRLAQHLSEQAMKRSATAQHAVQRMCQRTYLLIEQSRADREATGGG